MKKLFSTILVICSLFSGNAYSNTDVYFFLNNHELNSRKDLQPGYFHYIVVEDKSFQKLLSKQINDLPIYLGMSKDKKPFNSMFTELIRNHSASFKEIKINNENYFINSGCRFHSCDEKGFLWINKKKEIVLGANIHYFFNDKNDFNSQGDLLIFSKTFSSYDDLPKQFQKDLYDWLSVIVKYDPSEEDKSKQMKSFVPKKIRFINSQNEIVELDQIEQ